MLPKLAEVREARHKAAQSRSKRRTLRVAHLALREAQRWDAGDAPADDLGEAELSSALYRKVLTLLGDDGPARARDHQELAQAASRAFEEATRPQRVISQLYLKWIRRVVLASCALALVICGGRAWAESHANLLKGATTYTSSTYDIVPRDDMLFHTAYEHGPWIEFDFGKPTTFSTLRIVATEFGPERAVPLVVETRSGASAYAPLLRQEAVFSTWEPHFAPTTARYLRLRVDRASWLHLREVRAYR